MRAFRASGEPRSASAAQQTRVLPVQPLENSRHRAALLHSCPAHQLPQPPASSGISGRPAVPVAPHHLPGQTAAGQQQAINAVSHYLHSAQPSPMLQQQSALAAAALQLAQSVAGQQQQQVSAPPSLQAPLHSLPVQSGALQQAQQAGYMPVSTPGLPSGGSLDGKILMASLLAAFQPAAQPGPGAWPHAWVPPGPPQSAPAWTPQQHGGALQQPGPALQPAPGPQGESANAASISEIDPLHAAVRIKQLPPPQPQRVRPTQPAQHAAQQQQQQVESAMLPVEPAAASHAQAYASAAPLPAQAAAAAAAAPAAAASDGASAPAQAAVPGSPARVSRPGSGSVRMVRPVSEELTELQLVPAPTMGQPGTLASLQVSQHTFVDPAAHVRLPVHLRAP